MTRAETARENFYKGYNCCQSVVLAFADLTDLDADALSRAACSFGGGMGRLRQVCGAVSGMFMLLGLLKGYSGPETGEVKTRQYADVQALAAAFEQRFGTILCGELLNRGKEGPAAEARTADYYKNRPCAECIAQAAEILEAHLLGDN